MKAEDYDTNKYGCEECPFLETGSITNYARSAKHISMRCSIIRDIERKKSVKSNPFVGVKPSNYTIYYLDSITDKELPTIPSFKDCPGG
ncbi:hypothetical protein M0R01_03965 [bacterium]|nr:hypothetical protein [bacterium]